MNYIQEARKILGTKIQVEDDLLDLYTLLALVGGRFVSDEDVHNAWAVWRNKTNSKHDAIIPFCNLSEHVQKLDREYRDAIREAATELSK